jgi:cell division protein YceG involved in septum cleavage
MQRPNFYNGSKIFKRAAIGLILCVVVLMMLPTVLTYWLKVETNKPVAYSDAFPVTVDPLNKTITENEQVNSYLKSANLPLQASAVGSLGVLETIAASIADSISNAFAKLTGDDNLALAGGEKVVTIYPGLRREEVAQAFGKSLKWSEEQKKELVTPSPGSDLPYTEGSFFPGTYVVERTATPFEVQAMINERFAQNVLAHYSTSTRATLPINVALTVASLIQRETIGTEDMRLVSGIIWNRIFTDMNLQLDATLQYAKASTKKTAVWWPQVVPNDKYVKSTYNTYAHSGLPPTPIANPSVAAILAALNPTKTSCLFYFHDKKGVMHCSETYKQHVALLNKYY